MSRRAYPTFVLATLLVVGLMTLQTKALVPFARPLWDLDDPFRILEQAPFPVPIPKPDTEPTTAALMSLARTDWKETENSHIITLDVPGMTRDDVKIEVEENRVLRVSGERKVEEEKEGDRWHRVERTSGKFYRLFRLPSNADLEGVKAKLENGVLSVVVPKVAVEKRKLSRVVEIGGGEENKGEEVKATKADL